VVTVVTALFFKRFFLSPLREEVVTGGDSRKIDAPG
jgi:hypothetical protein